MNEEMLVIKVGPVVRKIKDGVYCWDIDPMKHPSNQVPNEMHVPRTAFENFVDFIDSTSPVYVGLYDYLFFNYDNPSGRIRLINDIDYDNELCTVITRDDAKFFMSLYDQYRNEIIDMPDEDVVALHPKIKPRYDMLKVLVWLCLWIEYATHNCINPGMLTYLYCDGE